MSRIGTYRTSRLVLGTLWVVYVFLQTHHQPVVNRKFFFCGARVWSYGVGLADGV